jgi:hypothetical protein
MEWRAWEKADEQARRIPLQKLLDARDRRIEWGEFLLWVRSILEVEDQVPQWLAAIVNQRCPGFLATETQAVENRRQRTLRCLRLGTWIDEHIFQPWESESWGFAAAYYSKRTSRYLRSNAYWYECVARWTQTKPIRYPSFEEWKRDAAHCDETGPLVPGVQRARASFKLVSLDTLTKTVDSYLEWQAFAYWARLALQRRLPYPSEVGDQLHHRCPSFLEFNEDARLDDPVDVPHDGDRLLDWIEEHFFKDAIAGGWRAALLLEVRYHPRSIRTRQYYDHCDLAWDPAPPSPFPSFETWRSEIETYLDLSDD